LANQVRVVHYSFFYNRVPQHGTRSVFRTVNTRLGRRQIQVEQQGVKAG
jgi:hypothetical protein